MIMKKKLLVIFMAISASAILLMFIGACNTNGPDEELAALKKEIQLLRDKMDIQDVLWRYGLRFDLDRKDEWFELFAEDCQFSSDVPGFLLELNGFDEIKAHYGNQSMQGPGEPSGGEEQEGDNAQKGSFTGHIDLAGVIKIEGDNATAVGWQVGTGVRTWQLRRTNGTWLITGTASRRLENKERCREVVPENW